VADARRRSPPPEPGERAAAVARYKTLLRASIERRPSGLRNRLALALGKHRSFVSQITNPAYAVPIPAADLPIIVEVCHLSPAEQEQFLAAYGEAHPVRQRRLRPGRGPAVHELRIALPRFRSADVAREVETVILEAADRIIRLARHAEAADTSTTRGGQDGEEVRQPRRRNLERGA
jgi:hypothetical protein